MPQARDPFSIPPKDGIPWRATSVLVATLLSLVACEKSPAPPSQTLVQRAVPRMFAPAMVVQLNPGTKPGTFRCPLSGAVVFEEQPLAILVRVVQGSNEVASRALGVNEPFAAEFDLLPGKYGVRAAVEGDAQPGFWEAIGDSFEISATGQKHTTHSQPLRFLRKMEELAPGGFHAVRERRPTLSWRSVAGAAQYRIEWFEQYPPSVLAKQPPGTPELIREQRFLRTDVPEFTFDHDLEPHRIYSWNVSAVDEGETMIAYSNDTFQTGSLGYLVWQGMKIPLSALSWALVAIVALLVIAIVRHTVRSRAR